MKTLVKRIAAGMGALMLVLAFSACKAENAEQAELSSDKNVLDALTVPSSETIAPNIAGTPDGSAKAQDAIELSYTIPDKFKKLFETTFNDLFAGKEVELIGAGEGSVIYESEDYPGLKLHFDSDKDFVTAIQGNISYLVRDKESLTFTEFRQIFGSDSITRSDMTGAYNAYIILDGQYKLMCGEFADENGIITTFVLANAKA